MKWIDLILNLPTNTAIGLVCAMFSMLLKTELKCVGLRNYIFIFVLNLFVTGLVIELFLQGSLWWWCGLAGLMIGWVIEDLYLNLETMLPELISGTIKDVAHGIRETINLKLGLKKHDEKNEKDKS